MALFQRLICTVNTSRIGVRGVIELSRATDVHLVFVRSKEPRVPEINRNCKADHMRVPRFNDLFNDAAGTELAGLSR